MSKKLNRRNLIVGTAAVGAAAYIADATGKTTATEQASDTTPATVRPKTKAVVDWPIWDSHEETTLLDVLNSGQWGRTTGGRRLKEFEAAFAEKMRARHCLATSSGTTALRRRSQRGLHKPQ